MTHPIFRSSIQLFASFILSLANAAHSNAMGKELVLPSAKEYSLNAGESFAVDAEIQEKTGLYELKIEGISTTGETTVLQISNGKQSLGYLRWTEKQPETRSLKFRLYERPSYDSLRFINPHTPDAQSSSKHHLTIKSVNLRHISENRPRLKPASSQANIGVYKTQKYRNVFLELGYSEAEIQQKIESAYKTLFHDPDLQNQSLMIPVGTDQAYIWDSGNNDVRSEGMSYGMMIAVQMDKQADFNRLWRWAITHSLNKTGQMRGYFAWQVNTSGEAMDANPAPDGEEYFVTALFFAAHRWGNGTGIFNYEAQANRLLKDMYANGKQRLVGQRIEAISLFNHQAKQIVFTPATQESNAWTDPSYHLPAFYELWSRWANKKQDFWAELATTSRDFFKKTAHPETGLSPDYAYFDGRPHGKYHSHKNTFQHDAWRTIGNAAMDYYWWKKDPWQVEWANRLLTFFASQGINGYPSLYELDGRPIKNNFHNSTGLVAMNALAVLAADSPIALNFAQQLWDKPIPKGKYRYYDGCLYMFSLLALSGQYRIYCPNNQCQ